MTDKSKPINDLISSAKLGDAEPQYLLGTMYQTGEGVDIDYRVAMGWYRLAAEQGLAKAQFKLGLSYQYGFASNPSYPKSFFDVTSKLTRYLHDYDTDTAINVYAEDHGIDVDFEKAVYWYELAAKHGDAKAQYKLGLFYFFDVFVQRSHPKAFGYFMMAAEQGLAKSQDEVGRLLVSGIGCEEDMAEGIRWLRLAAEQEYLPSILTMASYCHRGKGMPQSNAESLKWYRKSAALGDKDSQLCIEEFEEELNNIIPFPKRK